MTPGQILAAILLATVISAGGTWQVQGWRMGEQLAEQAGLHKDELAQISTAASAQVKAEQDKRLATEQVLVISDQQHIKELSNAKRNQALLSDKLASQSFSTPRMQPGASTCLQPPAPSAWFMQPVEPNLTRRMLNELSESPMPAIKD